MLSEDSKDVNDYLYKRAKLYFSEFSKKLESLNFKDSDGVEVEIKEGQIIGAEKDVLITCRALAQGIFLNEFDILAKVECLEIISKVSITLIENSSRDIEALKSELARSNAVKRHKETYELKKQAIDYWREKINPALSNDKAAELLTKIVPLSHRKLSQYIAEAKKHNIRSASKT